MQIIKPAGTTAPQASLNNLRSMKSERTETLRRSGHSEDLSPQQLESPIQSEWTNGDPGPKESLGALTAGEEQLINLMFDADEDSGVSLYGPKRPRPVPIGNFIDMRG
ncbi:MAG: hypothetical protein KAU50_10570 [Candidatus Marinimicrobia bacterium]|nr:hypothetical protein [Candidatus Neomarinimicrobiota bacterium]